MPLPAALAARLQKRGILNQNISTKFSASSRPKTKSVNGSEEVEEVFAEDYDEPSQEFEMPPEVLPVTLPTEVETAMEEETTGPLIHETSNCPNIDNPYHKCSTFCNKKWGYKQFEDDIAMEIKKSRMLRKYPLPADWIEVADPRTNRYYYWNIETDDVCWLSPLHPRADVTLSAEKRKYEDKTSKLDLNSSGSEAEDAKGTGEMDTDEEIGDFEEMEREIMEEKKEKERRRERQRDRGRDREHDGGRRKRGRQKDELDPMDPASYSDIARGTWSDGLDQRGKAKTGVDVTASGPLFQQRPYPSPGAILRMNQSSKPDEEDD